MATTTILTKRQKEVLDFITRFVDEKGYSPSLMEIGENFGLTSVATVHKHVTTLQQKGFLVRGPHQSRSIELGVRYHQETRKRAREQRHLAAAGTGTLPLLGRIAAGRPVEAVENPESISLADFAGKKEVFVLQVKGDSMVEDHILDGDYILLERTEAARNGDVVVALVDGAEATLKRFFREADGRVRLQPANASMAPLVLPAEAVKVQGRLIGVLRRY